MGSANVAAMRAFISYAREDAPRADWLQDILADARIAVWRDTQDLLPGDEWAAEIRRAIRTDSLVFLACFSAASVSRVARYQNEELVLAVEQFRLRAPGVPWLIPVRFDDCDLPEFDLGAGRTLASIQRADLFGARKAVQAERLVRQIHRIQETQVHPPVAAARLRRWPYLEQVRRIAPPHPPGLLGRDGELAELASFCVEPDRRAYTWWRAGPWAGKSALLSDFVLRPPAALAARGVQVVSFFITARLASQDTREAFTQVLIEELAALIGNDVPAALPEATRDAFLLSLLARAAADCERTGGRLILVVDGLDEDRSTTTGPDAHSIAGLLPGDPPAGMRVIVSSRLDPPVPDDVPDWHPLRSPSIIRTLDPSPHARDIERLARQELGRLLHGTAAEQDVLGLITAARGGLSAGDLVDLAGLELWEVEDILHRAQGRTFASRPSQHRRGAAGLVYLLGHEELQATAVRYLGRRLPGYHDRLAAWAQRWRDADWPGDTPEYLLSSYFQLAADLGDLPTLITLASDTIRHDRMLDLTGADAAALTEIRTALDAIAAQNDPDVADSLYLACHRDQLASRNMNIPTSLPGVWVLLGNPTRALALAASMSHLDSQAEALALVAESLASAGQFGQAETVARPITNQYWQAWALAQIARRLASVRQHDQAETVARSINNQYRQEQALAQIAGSLAGTGQSSQAETVARSIPDPYRQAVALAQVAESLARAGQHDRAAAIAGQAETVARSIINPRRGPGVLAEVAESLARAGQHDRAAAIAEHAETVARSNPDPHGQAVALARLASSLARAGLHDQAAVIAEQAEIVARSISEHYRQAVALTHVARSLARAGRCDRAESVARSIPDPQRQVEALAHVASSLARAGQHDQAATLAGRAETMARSITNPYKQATALAQVADDLARAGQHDQAVAVTRFLTNADQREVILTLKYGAIFTRSRSPGRQAAALTHASSLADAGQHGEAEIAARSIPNPDIQAEALTLVAGSLARAGQHGQAERVARSIPNPDLQAGALAQLAMELATVGAAVSARRIAAAALATGPWQIAAAAAIMLNDSAWAQIAPRRSQPA